MESPKNRLLRKLYYAAKYGMPSALCGLLHEPLNDVRYFIDHSFQEEDQLYTPLMIACINGHENVVQVMLNTFDPDYERGGIVRFNTFILDGATPLMCAAGAGHLGIVQILIRHGVNLNHTTATKLTPMIIACLVGRLCIVQCLFENGADITISNQNNETCLMAASSNGHLDIVSYLLSCNADINKINNMGTTALHFASVHGHLPIVKKLLEWGAKITKDNNGMTALIAAAQEKESEVVEFLIQQSIFLKQEVNDALELLGASFGNGRDSDSLQKAYYYFEWAMRRRATQSIPQNPKLLVPAIEAYGNHLECQTLQELRAIRYNEVALRMESLVIKERILGPKNSELPNHIIFHGVICANAGRFDQCIKLWLHALHLTFEQNRTICEDMLRFVQLFAQLLCMGKDLAVDSVVEVLSYTVKSLERIILNLHHSEGDALDRLMEELEQSLHAVVHLLMMIMKISAKAPLKDDHPLFQIVYALNILSLTTQSGSTPLHLAVNADTGVHGQHLQAVCKFPCVATASILIKCGANVNAMDHFGNTPLHIILRYQEVAVDPMTLHVIITKLLEAGAHGDYVNFNGDTPSDVATDVAEDIFKTYFKKSLKCLAARAVRKFHLPYENCLPHELISFTNFHGIYLN